MHKVDFGHPDRVSKRNKGEYRQQVQRVSDIRNDLNCAACPPSTVRLRSRPSPSGQGGALGAFQPRNQSRVKTG